MTAVYAYRRNLRRGNDKVKDKHQLGVVGNVVSPILRPVLGPGSTTPSADPPAQPTTPANNPPANDPPRNDPPANSPTAGPVTTSPASPANTPSTESSPESVTVPSVVVVNTVPGVVVVGGSTITTGTAPISVATAIASKESTTSTGVNGTDTTHGSTTSSTKGNPNPDADSGKDSGSGSTYSSSGSGTLGTDPIPSNTDAKALGDGKGGGVSGGAVAAAVIITFLVVIGVVVFLLRRRVRARRDEQAIKWWFTRDRTSQTYGDNEAFIPGSASRRSSFGTTIDHSNAAFLANTSIPPLPPMAEIGRPKGTAPTLVLDINADQNRFSIGSAGSHNSQFLVVHHRESLQPEVTPSMSGCTESFSFPKPPVGDRASMHSRGSDRSLANSPVKQSSPASTIKHVDDLIYLASPISPPIQNPLSPTAIYVQSAPVAADPFADNNPFEDHTPTGQFSEFELVRRPFFPQLQDELEVIVGESVRLVQIFDDGWALVEKNIAPKPGVEGQQGLIPLDCLRDVNENASANTERLSSQGGMKTL